MESNIKSYPRNWIFEPLHSAILFIAEEAKAGGLLKRALIHIENGRSYFELLRAFQVAQGNKDAIDAIDRMLVNAPYHEEWAAELRNNGHATLNAHALVAIWGALEVCVEDIVVGILATCPEQWKVIAQAGMKINPEKFEHPPSEENLRSLYRRIEDLVRVKHDVIATYENILNLFGLSAACSEHKAALLTANSLRNVIVHRGGLIDMKAAVQAPELSSQVGTKCLVSSEDFLRYHRAVSAFLVTLSGSIMASKYVYKSPAPPSMDAV